MQSFEKMYPNISSWVKHYGWIAIGADEYSDSLLRALNEGGLVWESSRHDTRLDDALNALEHALEAEMTEYA